MSGWTTLPQMLAEECKQSIEEGKDPAAVEALRAEIEAAKHDEIRLASLFEQLQALPIRADFGFTEPSDLAEIQKLRDAAPRIHTLPDGDTLADRFYGAWLGRCVGCALGKPIEGMMGPRGDISSKERIKRYLRAIDPIEYPLRDYIPQRSPAEDTVGRASCYPSTREQIRYMESDDDIRYTVLGQLIMQRHGRDFTTRDVATMWITRLPYAFVCTAETQAYRNLAWRYGHFNSDRHPDSAIDFDWVARHQNPYREWIGAQIRADSYGYAAPGHPELAADFAWRDARLSHVKNGIYGEMFCAAMIAAAFALDDPRAIVEAGLAEIPSTSRLHADVRAAIAICDRHGNDPVAFEAVLDDLYAALNHYHPVHTNNNAALVAAALLLGKHDFHQVVTIAVMGGWDTDCNGATAGSICGAMLGAKALPSHWTARLNDTLNSEIVGYHPIAISQCAHRSHDIARRILDL